MISRLRLLLSLGLFWLAYMITIRLAFLAYNHDLSEQLTAPEIWRTVYFGLRMDGSMTGYYLLSYGLILTAGICLPGTVSPGSWVRKAVKFHTVFLLVFSGIVVMVDMELYRHWGFRLNQTPFLYLGSGSFGSINPLTAFKVLAIAVILFLAYLQIFRKTVLTRLQQLSGPVSRWHALGMLLLSAFMLLPIRGSLTVAPMNAGFVYFHLSKPYANHAAINVIWNFVASLRKSVNVRYPEDFHDAGKTREVMASLYPEPDSTLRLLKVSRPNILLIILEGFTSDLIAPLGGQPDITPYLNTLSDEGVLFTHFYASGDRTDKGLASILSGYPAQPQTTIIKYPAKTQRLPSLAGALREKGYGTSFIYGGDADFASFRSYLTNMKFEHITDLDDFPDELNTSKWGVHDQYLFERVAAELDTTRSPFFKSILTLSSHEPFDVPVKPFRPGSDEESMYLNSCQYTDRCLGEFIAHAKKQAWWDSTLVVITADHGHRFPGNKPLTDERRFRIPMLWLGGALAKNAVRIETMGGQTDLANTLLGQLGPTDTTFIFSKNLLDTAPPPFAAFFFQNGYGFLRPGRQIIYDHQGKQLLRRTGADEKDIEWSKAYQQAIFSDYNRR